MGAPNPSSELTPSPGKRGSLTGSAYLFTKISWSSWETAAVFG